MSNKISHFCTYLQVLYRFILIDLSEPCPNEHRVCVTFSNILEKNNDLGQIIYKIQLCTITYKKFNNIIKEFLHENIMTEILKLNFKFFLFLHLLKTKIICKQ